MLEVLTIVGARPQFIKAAAFSRFLAGDGYHERIHETLVHTGQHYDDNMSAVFFREMRIPEPDVNLNIGSGSHGAMTGRMLEGIEKLVLERKPDVLLVYGDTNSTLAGALAASKLHVRVAHVEAGLRSFMMAMPEEQNRRMADILSSWLFCPTDTAIRNLGNEGIVHSGQAASPDSKVVVQSGDIMLDASNFYRDLVRGTESAVLPRLPDNFYLLTIHRAENTDDPARLAAIVKAVNARSDVQGVFPVHPRTRKILRQQGLEFGPHVQLIDPVGYFDMLRLEDACSFVMTDSGGVQKEAYFFGKPCMTLRDSTEWVELVDAGWNRIVGADEQKIAAAIGHLVVPGEHPPLYGSGNTAKVIADTLLSEEIN